MLKKITIAGLASLISILPIASNAEPIVANATLKPAENSPIISKYMYGQFSEHLGRGIYDGVWVGEKSSIPNVRGIRTDVVNALKDLKVPVIRWPGGCFADEYLWRDGIGPRDKRPSRRNNWWGGTPETNEFGSHEYFDFLEQVGAASYLSVNVGSSNPTDMREWKEYLSSDGTDTLANERRANGRDKPYVLNFIGIGNESWGCGGEMTAEYYANEYKRFSAFYHKAKPPAHISKDEYEVRVASGSNSYDTNWTDVVMKIAGRHMDAISLHYYTLPTGKWDKKGAATNFDKQAWYDTFYQTLKMDDIVSKHVAVMDKHDPKKRIGLYIDEWGTWYDVEKDTNPGHLYQLNTLRDGVVAAANFNIFHKYADRVKMTNIAQTINVLQAMILTKEDKIALTPTYYAFKMYIPFQDAQFIPVEYTAPEIKSGDKTIPAFNVTAAKAKDGKTYIGIANMSTDDSINLTFNLGDAKFKNVTGEVLTSQKLDDYNDFGKAPIVAPVKFNGGKIKNGVLTLNVPSKSVVVVSVN